MIDSLKVPSNPRVRSDESGQWWYHWNTGARARCEIRTCAHCGVNFVSYPSRPYRQHCSRICGRNCTAHPEHVPARRRQIDGPRHYRWKGGKIIRKGYVLTFAPDHHSIVGRGTQRKYVLEHRIVMEGMLGRPLAQNEQIHHKNGIKHDNRPENLELWTHQQPCGQRANEIRVAHCVSCTCFHANGIVTITSA